MNIYKRNMVRKTFAAQQKYLTINKLGIESLFNAAIKNATQVPIFTG